MFWKTEFLSVSVTLPSLCAALNSKVRRKKGSTHVLELWSELGLPGEAEPAELRLEKSPGCCNQTRILHNWLPGNPGHSRPQLQQGHRPQFCIIPKVFLHLKSSSSHFLLLTLYHRRNCCPGQNEVYLVLKSSISLK